MKAAGIVAVATASCQRLRIDDLGRVVIPKEIGAHNSHREGDPLLTTLKRSDMFASGMMRLQERLKRNGT